MILVYCASLTISYDRICYIVNGAVQFVVLQHRKKKTFSSLVEVLMVFVNFMRLVQHKVHTVIPQMWKKT